MSLLTAALVTVAIVVGALAIVLLVAVAFDATEVIGPAAAATAALSVAVFLLLSRRR